ncbi:MAG: diguanylate cyclase [Cellvibrionaceae bacterium]|nr:diguanylate cyclase [Cellvibrionaceae bacterium]
MQQKNKKNLILIVDTDTEALRGLGELLKPLGNIIFATSGKAGHFMACHRKPDLVITATDLDDISGLDLCKRIRSHRESKECSVIVIAQARHRDLELQALEAGAVDFITHPFLNPVMQARVRTHLALSRRQNLLQVLADRDGLTEVYNRRYFENQARVELKRHFRQQQALTLALLDIDHFKPYNDAYGHLQGDLCLRDVAHAIGGGSRRPGEFVARYGGEEFAVVLPNTNAQNARKYGRWICQQVLSLAIPHGHSETLPFITISAGIATVVPNARTTLENLIATADSALYLAKESGRNQFKVAAVEQETIKEAG